MGVRDDRLRAELDQMRRFRSEVVTWRTLGYNNPPDKYQLTYKLRSIIGFNSDGSPQFHTGFLVEISFPHDYPRRQPNVQLVSYPWPVHPNIWKQNGEICLEGTQHWIAGIGVSLDALVFMIGEIIAFQEVNLGSRANADSNLINWVQRELRFDTETKVANPVDPSPIRLPDLEDMIRWGDEPKEPPRIRFGD